MHPIIGEACAPGGSSRSPGLREELAGLGASPVSREVLEPLLAALHASAPAAPAEASAGPAVIRELRPLLPLAAELLRLGWHEDLSRLCDAVRALKVDGALDGLGLSVVELCARVSDGAVSAGALGADSLLPTARRVLASADAALDAGEISFCCELATATLRLVFHRDLHAEGSSTPLVDAPSQYLAPLADSRVWKLLTSARPRRPAPDRRPDVHGRTRVLVLPGAYPRFAGPLVRALVDDARAQVEVVDVSAQHPVLSWLGVNRRALEIRVRHALGQPIEVGTSILPAIDRADVVVADWADRGAMWASLMVPEGTRLVVRIHSADALGLWLHLIDWTSVEDVLFVSSPVGDLTDDALSGRLTARRHVVGNGVDLLRFAAGEGAREPHTLGVIGWGRLVKDPLFAVEVLARLRARDPGNPWRLRLVGPDLEDRPSERVRAYRRIFHARILEDDVRDHIEFVGETAHVERVVGTLGFALSTSLRESFHVALVEAAAGGAIPVVRDWPALALRRAAARIYPRAWVVDDVESAVERVLTLRDPAAREAEARATRALVNERFSLEGFERRVCDAVLGPVLDSGDRTTSAG